ncbi:hypothetical protein SCOCK_290030 [Actinacidiphila cocklensis]|uniref:Uncharacterized protein n=1 Tax=Actinacidiphila cocklensis TaxID=887465 RepID=A0A9W4DVI6_9ACTN|nr:hypothetical protein SCOCK_290030 [Actinacidiphila cocklensis]
MLWSTPRLICVAEDFTRYDRHAVGEIRRCIDLVRYRFFGAGLLGLEPVVAAAACDRGPGAGAGRAGRMPKEQPTDGIGELRPADRERWSGAVGDRTRRPDAGERRGCLCTRSAVRSISVVVRRWCR